MLCAVSDTSRVPAFLDPERRTWSSKLLTSPQHLEKPSFHSALLRLWRTLVGLHPVCRSSLFDLVPAAAEWRRGEPLSSPHPCSSALHPALPARCCAWEAPRGARRQPACCCGNAGRPCPGAASLAGGGWDAVRWGRPAPPARPCHRPPRHRPPARGWELSTEGGTEGREEAEGRGHLRSPNFLPAFCSHFAPAKLKGGVRGKGGGRLREMKGRG